MLKLIIIVIIFALLQKKIRFYFVTKKHKKTYPIMKGAEPYFIKKGKTGVLLLHGLTSTPQELRFLAKYLASKNFSVYAPLIKGHGTNVIDLARTKEKDWENSALKGFDKLSKSTNRVYVIGSSMGGNLSFRIATKRNVEGIVVMGTAMFFKRQLFNKILFKFIKLFKNFVRKEYPDEKIKKLVKKKTQYMEFPLNCISDLIKLIRISEKDLPKITAPSLIMQSSTDHILPKENAQWIYKHIGSVKKRIFMVPNSYHVFCIDKNRNIAFKEIYRFIKETS
ncbi:hypothetical protein CEE44_01225 [Candidatus Woesearchaeota archaeon B3_Woes]|nr:MAG: hypothetical protein CEE44_01225 [Candidatus Woesearchaeota archaeon B3_Woes]